MEGVPVIKRESQLFGFNLKLFVWREGMMA